MAGRGRGGGHHFMGHDYVVLALEDLVALTRALREAFPRIRFMAALNDPNVDWEASVAQWRELNARGVPNDPTDPANPRKYVPRPSSEFRIPYVDGLEQTEVWNHCDVWVEPEGWTPAWGSGHDNYPIVVNRPSLALCLNYSGYESNKVRLGSRTPLHARSDDEVVSLSQGNWFGSYYDGKPEQKAFLAKVKRIVAKHTINEYAQIDPQTGAVLYRDERGDMLRFGFHALEWARAHRNHFLDHKFKPIDWNPPA